MKEPVIRRRWLKAMYLCTAAGAGALGVAMILAPARIAAILRMPHQDAAIFGLVASAYVAFGLLALLGLRAPVRFAPILALQMIYKVVWIATVFLPLAIARQANAYAYLFAAIFFTYVLGDLIAIPFRRLFAPETPS
ncbi:hypothetical protein [Rhodoblastus sp.]|uniref:hypothetical protein n=1 Tax=Rhodoblastus sp. TaxID=1962975 RepID=UPI003F987FC4